LTSSLAAAAAAVVLIVFVPESRSVLRIGRERSRTFLAMRSQHLERLRGRTGVAVDIGMIGYFSQGVICDLGGLVQGKAWAAADDRTRLKQCAQTSPDFIFTNHEQAEEIGKYVNLQSMVSCFDYRMPNVANDDVHTLFLARAYASSICASSEPSSMPDGVM